MDLEKYKNLSLEDLFKLVDDIKKKGYLFFLKIDGERDEDYITIIISDPKDLSKEQIRFDGDDLKINLTKSLSSFFSAYEQSKI